MGESASGEKEGGRVDSGQYSVGIPRVALGEKVPLPGVHLEEGIFASPRTKDLEGAIEQRLTGSGRNMHRRQITWLQIFVVLHHKLQAPV